MSWSPENDAPVTGVVSCSAFQPILSYDPPVKTWWASRNQTTADQWGDYLVERAVEVEWGGERERDR